MSQAAFPQAIICVYRRDYVLSVPESKNAPLEIPTQSAKASESYHKPPRWLNDFEPTGMSSDLGIGNLSVMDESPEDSDDFAMENQISSLDKGLNGIWSREDMLSYVGYAFAEPPNKQEEFPIPDQAIQPDLQETPEELASRVSALIISGMGQWSFQFKADYPTKTHFSGRAAKQGRIPWVNRAQRAARAAVVLTNRNIKKAQLARKRQDEREEKKKERRTKGDYNEGEGKWLCHECDDKEEKGPYPMDDVVPLCPECDHPHKDCEPCHDPDRLAKYFRLKREERERNLRIARA